MGATRGPGANTPASKLQNSPISLLGPPLRILPGQIGKTALVHSVSCEQQQSRGAWRAFSPRVPAWITTVNNERKAQMLRIICIL